MQKTKSITFMAALTISMLLLGGEIIGYHQYAFAGGGGGGGHHGPPLSYFLYWPLLLICLVRVAKFLREYCAASEELELERVAQTAGTVDVHDEHGEENAHGAYGEHDEHGGHHHPEPSALDKFLVITVLLMFIIDQFPLAHYHEASFMGFVRFVLKAGLGVSLMAYGILGMEEH